MDGGETVKWIKVNFTHNKETMWGLEPWKHLKQDQEWCSQTMRTWEHLLRKRSSRAHAWEPGSPGLRPQDGLLYADWAPGLLLTWGSSVLSLTLHWKETTKATSLFHSGTPVKRGSGDFQVPSLRLCVWVLRCIPCFPASLVHGAPDSQGHCECTLLSQCPLSCLGSLLDKLPSRLLPWSSCKKLSSDIIRL